MTHLELLNLASARFVGHLASVTPVDWTRPTPCDDWDVGRLVDHVIGGNHFTVEILGGASAAEAMTAAKASFTSMTDRTAALEASITTQARAFGSPGALERLCHHEVGDLPGDVILGFRLTDLTIHGWDLARGVGGDETIPPPLVEAVWAQVSRTADQMAGTGLFGDGASGDVPDTADLQTRLLDATGRRV